jgi:hypothetical protein
MNPHTICLLFLALISTVGASAQIHPTEGIQKALAALWSENLYVRSLSACVEAKDSGGLSSNVIVLQNDVLGRLEPVVALPPSIGSATIEYLTSKAVMERYKRLRQKLGVLEIQPLNNSRDELVVNCSVYSVGMRRRKLVLGVSGGYMVHWRYDCQSKEFVRARVEPWYPRI